MLGKFGVLISVVMAALISAPTAVAMPPDQCARWRSGRSDYQYCMANCLQGR